MKILVLSAMFLTLAACGVKGPIEGRADPYSQKQLYFASADLANKTAVGPINTFRKNGILYVEIPIRSASDYDLHVDAQVTFYTAEGTVDYRSNWEAQQPIVRNTQEVLRFNSTTGNAADFKVQLRYSE